MTTPSASTSAAQRRVPLAMRLPPVRLLAHLAATTLSDEESRLASVQLAGGAPVDEGRGDSAGEGDDAAPPTAAATGGRQASGRGGRAGRNPAKGNIAAAGTTAAAKGATAAASGAKATLKPGRKERADNPRSGRGGGRGRGGVTDDDSDDGGLFDGTEPVDRERSLRDPTDVVVADASGTESEGDGEGVVRGKQLPAPVFEPLRVVLPPSHLREAKHGMFELRNPGASPVVFDFRRASFEADWTVVPAVGVVAPNASMQLVVGSIHGQPGRFDMRASCELHGARSRTLSLRVLASAHDVQLVPLSPSVFLPPVALGHQCSTTLPLQCTSTVSCYYSLEISSGAPALSLQPENGILQVRLVGRGGGKRGRRAEL